VELNPEAEKFKRSELPERYTARIFFFLNQQFITQGMRADHDNYFITIYIGHRLT